MVYSLMKLKSNLQKAKQSKPLKGGRLDYSLFLGLPVTPVIAANLARSHAPSVALFISENKGLYLEKRFFQEVVYLGKTLDSLASLEELQAMGHHLQSLLCRVLDQELVRREDFVLFAFS